MMMTGLAVQLFGGPLDGLELKLPERKPELHFPRLRQPLADAIASNMSLGELTEELVYVWTPDVNRYLWRPQ